MLTFIPLSLYIHLPWCVRKCPYCDFNSHALPRQSLPEADYIDALILDLKHDKKWVGTREVTSIFFGGGTPSLFSGEGIARILSAVQSELNCAQDIEITLEANPGAIEHARFEHYLLAGVNRLSIGIQSFNDQHLKRLGRIHKADEAIHAMSTAQQAGFDNINLDLMFGLPQQTPEEALADLQQASVLKPTHISWYQLTLEPNTLFYSKPPALPDDELIWQMQQTGQAFLAAAGYEQYEVSAYAQAGKQCRHNRNYWEFGDYIGIGAGAHGKITLEDGTIIRTAKTRQPKDYLGRVDSFLSENRIVSPTALPFEYMLNLLRLKTPIFFAHFEQHTGLNREILVSGLQQATDRGLLEYDDSKVMLTEQGYHFIDDILRFF